MISTKLMSGWGGPRQTNGPVWRRCTVAVIAAIFLLVTLPVPARAATIRGRLEHLAPNGQRTPASGVKVTIYRQASGRSAPVVTDANGMFYFNGSAGSWWLEVWISSPPRAYQINVVEPSTDIPPIVI